MTTPPGWNQAQQQGQSQYPPPQPQPAGQPQFPPPGHQPYPGQYPGQPPYPPPGQPPYGGQPQFPPPPPSGGNRRGRIALVAVSLVVVAALGTVLYLVLGGDDNGSTRANGDSGSSGTSGSSGSSGPSGSSGSSVVAPTTPKGAAKAWLEAVKSGDLDAVKENSCDSFAAEIAANPPSKPDAFVYHIREVTQRNGRTEVAVTERIARDGHITDSDQVLEIVEEDGRLKVCGESTPRPEGG